MIKIHDPRFQIFLSFSPTVYTAISSDHIPDTSAIMQETILL